MKLPPLLPALLLAVSLVAAGILSYGLSYKLDYWTALPYAALSHASAWMAVLALLTSLRGKGWKRHPALVGGAALWALTWVLLWLHSFFAPWQDLVAAISRAILALLHG